MTIAGTLASPTLAHSIINVSFPLAYYELIMVATVFRGFVRNGVCACSTCGMYCRICGATNDVAYTHGYVQFIDWLKKLWFHIKTYVEQKGEKEREGEKEG